MAQAACGLAHRPLRRGTLCRSPCILQGRICRCAPLPARAKSAEPPTALQRVRSRCGSARLNASAHSLHLRRADPVRTDTLPEDVEIMQPDFAADVSLHAGQPYRRGAGLNCQLAAGCLTILTVVAGCQRAEEIRWRPSRRRKNSHRSCNNRSRISSLDTAARRRNRDCCPNPKCRSSNCGAVGSRSIKSAAGLPRRDGRRSGGSGRGIEPVPARLSPRVFKFTSTPYGGKPTRDDLLRTVRNGSRERRCRRSDYCPRRLAGGHRIMCWS